MKKTALPPAASPAHPIDALFARIKLRRRAKIDLSYTARLWKRGLNKIAQKVGEEATEVVIAALAQDKAALAEESADLLYHLLLLWQARGITPTQVYRVLAKRAAAKP